MRYALKIHHAHFIMAFKTMKRCFFIWDSGRERKRERVSLFSVWWLSHCRSPMHTLSLSFSLSHTIKANTRKQFSFSCFFLSCGWAGAHSFVCERKFTSRLIWLSWKLYLCLFGRSLKPVIYKLLSRSGPSVCIHPSPTLLLFISAISIFVQSFVLRVSL